MSANPRCWTGPARTALGMTLDLALNLFVPWNWGATILAAILVIAIRAELVITFRAQSDHLMSAGPQ